MCQPRRICLHSPVSRVRCPPRPRELYGEIDSIDFPRDVLSREPRSLLVMEGGQTGNTERVISTLDRHQIEPQWLIELRNGKSELNQRVPLNHQTMSAFSELVTV